MTKPIRMWGKLFLSIFFLILLFVSCNENPLLNEVTYTIEPNLETAKIDLLFSENINTDLGGSFPVKNYGVLEMQPTTRENPFRMGFRLNLSVLTDQEYLEMRPTSVLPMGDPIPGPMDRAMVEVKVPNNNSPLFTVYAYLDVLGQEWVGMVVLLNFIDNGNFPANLMVSRSFLKGTEGNYFVMASVFGPSVDSLGKLLKPGGLSLFANLKGLIRDKGVTPLVQSMLISGAPFSGSDDEGSDYFLWGPRASYYRKNPEKLLEAEKRFVDKINRIRN